MWFHPQGSQYDFQLLEKMAHVHISQKKDVSK